jgi:hypothetical protein
MLAATEAPALDRLGEIDISFGDTHVHSTPVGLRLHCVIGQGRFEGPGLRGAVVGGSDWVLIGADGTARLDVRATLRTDDGALIAMTNTGRVHMDNEASGWFRDGGLVRAEQMYARSSPLFETGDERYAWLNSVHTLAVLELSMAEVHYRVWAVR